MTSSHVSQNLLPLASFDSKPRGAVSARKLLTALLLGLLLAFFCSQLNFSDIGEKFLPGAMPYVFQNHPGQNLRRLLSNQMIFAIHTDEVSYVVCPIPKNGCSYHIGLLHRVNGVENYEKFAVIHNKTAKSDLDISRFPTKRITKWLMDTDIPRYAVIRNPLMRTLSAYLDKVEPDLEEDMRTPDSFEKWVEEEFPPGSGRQKEVELWNVHWRPQVYYCGFKTDNVHRSLEVLRFEEPEKIVEFLYESIPQHFLVDGWGGEANSSLHDFMLGPRKRTGGTEEKFLTYFRSVDTFDKLVTELEDDINFLGYQEEIKSLRNQVLLQQGELYD